MQRVSAWLQKLSAVQRDSVFWFIALLCLLPAIKAGVLFPNEWLDPSGRGFIAVDPPNIFGWFSIVLGAAAIVFASKSQFWFGWLVAVTHWINVAGVHTDLFAVDFAYSVLALSVFVCFVLRGRANSLAFAGFVVALIWLTRSDETLTFPAIAILLLSTIVMRLIVEAIRQNWPLAKQLGKRNVFALTGKTLLLWWPMLLLIGAGFYISDALKTGTENALYAQEIVTPHCAVDGADVDAVIPCTRKRLRLKEYEDIILKPDAARGLRQRDFRVAVSTLSRQLRPLIGDKPATDLTNPLRAALNASKHDEAAALLDDVDQAVSSLEVPEPLQVAQVRAPAERQVAHLRSMLVHLADNPEKLCVLRAFDYVEVVEEPQGAAFSCPTGYGVPINVDHSPDLVSVRPEPEVYALRRIGFFDSAYRSINRDYEEHQFELREKADSMRQRAGGSIARARNEAESLFDLVPRTTGMQTRDCDFLEAKCGASNYVIVELNDAYEAQRSASHRDYIDELDRLQGDANGSVDVFVANAELALSGRLEMAREFSLQAVRRIETGANVVGTVLQLLLIVAIIKSLLYVFARVIFDKRNKIDVDLSESTGPVIQGTVRQTAEVEIPADYDRDIYYRANFQPLGPAARFSIPQWTKSWLARIRFGTWHMSRAAFPLEHGNGLTFNSVEAEHLVDWAMKPGEEVVFRYDNFVAMNSEVELNTVISLRVSNLLLGRLIWHTARCTGEQGRLVLRTRGKPATAAQVKQSIPATRLIAFNRDARFSVDSHLTPQDVFLNGFNLSRSDDADATENGILIVEADARDGGLLIGTLRFARNFLLPI